MLDCAGFREWGYLGFQSASCNFSLCRLWQLFAFPESDGAFAPKPGLYPLPVIEYLNIVENVSVEIVDALRGRVWPKAEPVPTVFACKSIPKLLEERNFS